VSSFGQGVDPVFSSSAARGCRRAALPFFSDVASLGEHPRGQHVDPFRARVLGRKTGLFSSQGLVPSLEREPFLFFLLKRKSYAEELDFFSEGLQRGRLVPLFFFSPPLFLDLT